jgi:hypothetical protein
MATMAWVARVVASSFWELELNMWCNDALFIHRGAQQGRKDNDEGCAVGRVMMDAKILSVINGKGVIR